MPSALKSARRLVGLVLCGWVLTFAPTAATTPSRTQPGFQTYTNTRFGYRIAYPADFTPQGESDNGDGQVFTGGDDAELRVWGGYNVLGETPASALREELRRCAENQRQVTYRTVGRGFFVVSGYESDGTRIFYLRKIVRPSLQVGFEFVYPVNNRARYDREVGVIANSLRLPSRQAGFK
ncbi:hypothetical protein J8C02_04165 [Chloracidobacterium sp. MS 40/45]|uniref:hypothetical protein n=1 Tax=Chloracidobacterium aggregatum TaxID=2851959 RepID=UPI001B8C9EB7|nr:hypothetical protein [Chloracidobacterium aggregatum]QUW00699.1 hypothetical protein J8C02_04165 [Chloracidobacterium sp. MS 40/45]